jgi:hypothetical protein
MQLLGFNAVRLPFSFKDFLLPAREFYWCQTASYDDIRKSVTPPGLPRREAPPCSLLPPAHPLSLLPPSPAHLGRVIPPAAGA